MANPNFNKALQAQRLARLRQLRAISSPRWIVRSEQVALLLNREGLQHKGIGKAASKRQKELYDRFVLPTMGQ